MTPRKYIKTIALALAFGAAAGHAEARPVQHHHAAHHQTAGGSKARKPAGKAANYAAMVINAEDGRVLYARNSAARLHPASTTKIMTAYLVFDALKSGRLRLDQRIPVSRHAAEQPRTNLGMMRVSRVKDPKIPGHKQTYHTEEEQSVTSITVENALRGMLCHSANDAAMVFAEAIGGTEDNFVRMMNAKAKELGLTRTHYVNPNGLPADSQVTSPEDLARLARAVIRDFPQDYKYFDIESFAFNGQSFRNTNNLLGHYPGIDGIKTGWIATSGYNLAASAKHGSERVIGVIFGARSPLERRDDMTALLDFGFAKIKDPAAKFTRGPNDSDSVEYIEIPPAPGEEDAPPAPKAPATPPALPKLETLTTPALKVTFDFNQSSDSPSTGSVTRLSPPAPGAPDQPPLPEPRQPVILPQLPRIRGTGTQPPSI